MTAKSMTGFGKAHGVIGDWTADLTIRSVNHRFLDISIRLRDELLEAESALRKVISERVTRGKVDLSVRLRRHGEGTREVRIAEDLLEKLLGRLADLSTRFPLEGRLEIRDVLLLPDVVSVEAPPEALSPEEIDGLIALAAAAVAELVRMRESEGRLLAADICERIALLQEKLARVSQAREAIVGKLHEALRERLAVLFRDVAMDPSRLAQEAVLLADRSDVTEEVTRMSAHLSRFVDLLETSEEPVGKKLDFLTQEIQREINTLGAKSRDSSIAHDVIEMRTEAEKIREQIQNLE